MNKKELISAIAKKTNSTKVLAEQHLAATIEIINKALSEEEEITIIGFGTLKTAKRAPRKGRVIKTGLQVQIPARKVPVFVAGKSLKELVNK